MKRFLAIFLIICIFASPALVYGAEENTEITLVNRLQEIKKVYFQWRIATLVYNTKALHRKIGEKLMATENEDMPEGAMRVIRDYIKSLRPETDEEVNAYFSTKLPILIKGIYQRLANNFALKLESMNGELSLEIFKAIEKNDSAKMTEMLDYLKKYKGIASTAFTGTLFVLDTKLQFELRYADDGKRERIAGFAGDINKLHDKFDKFDTYKYDHSTVNNIAKMTNTRLWKWLSKAILVETQDTPSKLEWQHMIEINTASIEDLMNIPGVAAKTAQKIVDYRTKNKMIVSINELNNIKGIGLKTLRRIKTVAYVNEFKYPKKDTTVLCFFNGDNDLELSCMLAINTFEKVGTTDNMNIIVQADRIGQESLAHNNQGDSDSWFDGNWTTTRRYLIKKDNVPFKLGSVLMEKMGEVDMGSKDSLTDFVKWGVEHFPAKKYVLIICNHGSEFGIGGISFDEENDNHFDTIELGDALKSVNNVFKKSTGNDKFHSMIFDCCLMSNVETMAEIKDYTKSSFACENVQITWYDYDKFFQYMTDNPNATPSDTVKSFLTEYCKSMNGTDVVLTASALNLERFDDFYIKFKDFAKELNNFTDRAPEKVKDALVKMTPIKGVTVFDIITFAKYISENAKDDPTMKQMADELIEVYGEPTNRSNEFLPEFYPEGKLIVAEAHNNHEPTAHGLAIHFNDKFTWAEIAKTHSQGEVMTEEWISKWTKSWFQRFPYQKLRVSTETEWDEFLTKSLELQ